MDLAIALQTVKLDVWQSYRHLSLPLAIEHALNVTSLDTLNEDDENTYPAYKVMHEASVAEIVLSVAKTLELTLDEGDVWESTDGHISIDGLPPFEWLDSIGG